MALWKVIFPIFPKYSVPNYDNASKKKALKDEFNAFLGAFFVKISKIYLTKNEWASSINILKYQYWRYFQQNQYPLAIIKKRRK